MNVRYDFAFLDSGTGGIPYMCGLLKKCPSAECVYVGDTKNFPYGEKTSSEIQTFVLQNCNVIIDRFNPRAIIVACNTMSVNTLSLLRKTFTDRIFIGTVPAIKPAAAVSKKRCIGLLATKATVENAYNKMLEEEFASDCKFVLRPDAELISFIEKKSFTASEEQKLNAVKPAVDFFRQNGCDAFILGCTHFLNLTEEFKKVAGEEIAVVDSCDGVTNRALSLVNVDSGKLPVKPKLFVTGLFSDSDRNEYETVCSKKGIDFCGLLE